MKEIEDMEDDPSRGVILNWGDVIPFGSGKRETDESVVRRLGFALIFSGLQGGCSETVLLEINDIFGLGLSEAMLVKGRKKVVMKTRRGEYVAGEWLGKVECPSWGDGILKGMLDSKVMAVKKEGI